MRSSLHDHPETLVRPILAAVKSIGMSHVPVAGRHTAEPFVTISRESGAGGVALAERLVEHLNHVDPGERLRHSQRQPHSGQQGGG